MMELPHVFHAHGFFCASHPWEVIFFTLTLTLCMVSMGGSLTSDQKLCGWNGSCSPNEFDKDANIVIMTIIRCMAVLYIYHQLRNLCKLGSKHILGIAGIFTVYSSFVFSTSVINFLQRDIAELNEAIPFFLLLIDISKASLLAQFALMASNQQEVRDNIARGLSVLGPTITLDTIVKTLVIGVGTLSGLKHLEGMCCFACLSVIVNYLVFMTFFPACLSLVMELSRDRDDSYAVSQLKSFTSVLQEEKQKPNPVVQRVKVIMSAGLLLVHAHSRWPLNVEHGLGFVNQADSFSESVEHPPSSPESNLWMTYFTRWMSVSTDRLTMLVLALALSVKYFFFESKDNITEIMMAEKNKILQMENRKDSYLKQELFFPGTTITDHHTKQEESKVQVVKVNKFVQTEEISGDDLKETTDNFKPYTRPLPICQLLLKTEAGSDLSDDEILLLLAAKCICSYQIEKLVNNPERAVIIRRRYISSIITTPRALDNLPYKSYDYTQVLGVCAENVIGYTPVPLGIVGPLLMDGKEYQVPMATTEGCLIASTNRGCRALMVSGGVKTSTVGDGMTRGPVVRLQSAQKAAEVKRWISVEENFVELKASFDSTSRFARLQKIHTRIAGRYLFIRFQATTGDAMGMNMLSKGSEVALKSLQSVFPSMDIVSLSGNYCTDKKPSAINWIEGRGKSVVCEAVIPAKTIKEILKTNVHSLVDVNIYKNLVGSAVAGSIGGFNAHAANIVTAIFIATGQDPAQNVTSSNCMTLMEPAGDSGEDLYISCTMPSIEIGTIGGGTALPAQSACLELMSVKGSCIQDPGGHATKLACIVCASVLAGELSLMSALSAGHLVSSHLKLNRKKAFGSTEVLSQVSHHH